MRLQMLEEAAGRGLVISVAEIILDDFALVEKLRGQRPLRAGTVGKMDISVEIVRETTAGDRMRQRSPKTCKGATNCSCCGGR